ncbi:MAG: FeoB-associated Cys-rich membrane protein [Clostridia bacterium]|nr:FeoB-associated Cys-rich membrane protein [Clostridia bacterium]
MNLPTFIVCAVLAVILFAIIFTSVRNHKKGKSSCSGCSGCCSNCSGCPSESSE